MKKILLFILLLTSTFIVFSQDVFLKDVLKENREKLYRSIINNTINKNLSLPLTDSTEENWQDAFDAMQLVNYKSAWAENKIRYAVNVIQTRSTAFQLSLLQLIHVNYPMHFLKEIKRFSTETNDIAVFASCAGYLTQTWYSDKVKDSLVNLLRQKNFTGNVAVILPQLLYQLKKSNEPYTVPSIHTFLQKDYLPGQVLMFSFQRMNRSMPGLVMVRDTAGNFIIDDNGIFFYKPQLARSLGNMPYYFQGGNTPEGIFRMDGFGNSKSSFIGPTTNIQLTMPFEYSVKHFFNDSSLLEGSWDIELYKKMLPENFRDHFPSYQSFYAGQAGRTEIIAHGTAVDPGYYKGMIYYPLTPTLGCLCTKEIWDETTGRRLESDQQKLADAITKAGGPHGYAIVINIDDKQEPVSIDDIIPFLKLAMQK